MKRIIRKYHVLAMALLLCLSLLSTSTATEAAGKKTTLNKTAVTLTVGKSVQLKVQNPPKRKKITWSSSKKSAASVTNKGKVTAKTTGR